jgi:hypothetical protein
MARLRLVTIYSIGGSDDDDVTPLRYSRGFFIATPVTFGLAAGEARQAGCERPQSACYREVWKFEIKVALMFAVSFRRVGRLPPRAALCTSSFHPKSSR